ncbi:MAG: DEAD/DEAH box helicase [Proteobacteria bacterium]|nr:DEAD/DEAH box helicase [Pseudomonadota bacterium]
MGYERCTPVQEQSLPDSLAGMDIISQSQTGTGKTAVFLITALNRLNTGELKKGRDPRALILVPTRELATQVSKEADKLGNHLSLRSIAIYGGVDYDKQIGPLKEGVDIIVATPGRLMDLYKSKAFSLSSIEMFIIDEADRMFDMGFAPDVRYIAGRLPKDKERQTLLFSATIDYNVKSLASRYMKPDPVLVEIEPESVTVDAIDQKVLYVSNEEKLGVLMGLLKRPDTLRTIIFTNMKRTAEMLEWKLKENGLEASVLTGDVSQSKRERIMASMKAGKVNTLIATDVAARGVHIDDVTHVINYDLPEDPANYVHRIGRTARAGKSGKAYSLGCEDSVFNLPAIEEYIERKIDNEWMDEDEVVKDKAGRYRGSRTRTAGPAKRPARSGTKRPDRGPRSKSTSSRSSSGGKKPSSSSSRPAAKSQSTASKASASKEPTKESKGASTETSPAASNEGGPRRPHRPRGRRPAKSADGAAKSTQGSQGSKERPRKTSEGSEKRTGEQKRAQQPRRTASKRPSGDTKERTRTPRSSGRPAKPTKSEDTSSDARLSFYKPGRGLEPSSRKKSAAAVKPKEVPVSAKAEEKTSGLIKRVLKSFWKK